MGYDYSLGFLGRHHETVQKLVQIARTGEVLVYKSETWEPIRQRHQLVRSLLANMDRNLDDAKGIKQVIRTWTAVEDELFVLYVGRPTHKVTGRPPSEKIGWADTYVPKQDSAGVFNYPIRVDPENFEVFVGRVVEQGSHIKRVVTRMDNLEHEEAASYLNDIFGPYSWRVASIEGDILTLERL